MQNTTDMAGNGEVLDVIHVQGRLDVGNDAEKEEEEYEVEAILGHRMDAQVCCSTNHALSSFC